MSLRKRLLRIVAIVILTPTLFLLGCQSRLIYHPNYYRAEHEKMLLKAKGERLAYETKEGKQTVYYIPPREAAAGTGQKLPGTVWLCFGGNGSLALDWLFYTERWDGRFAYLMVDYPSYGECAGSPTPESIRESSKAAVEALAGHLGITREALQPRLAVLGHSLGAAAGLMAAEDLGIRRGVLFSPFTSMTDMGRIVLGWPLCHLNLHRFDNRRALQQVAAEKGARWVIFHGTADEVIPIRMGRELAAAHPETVTFHAVEGAYHNDIFDVAKNQTGPAMVEVAPAAPPAP